MIKRKNFRKYVLSKQSQYLNQGLIILTIILAFSQVTNSYPYDFMIGPDAKNPSGLTPTSLIKDCAIDTTSGGVNRFIQVIGGENNTGDQFLLGMTEIRLNNDDCSFENLGPTPKLTSVTRATANKHFIVGFNDATLKFYAYDSTNGFSLMGTFNQVKTGTETEIVHIVSRLLNVHVFFKNSNRVYLFDEGAPLLWTTIPQPNRELDLKFSGTEFKITKVYSNNSFFFGIGGATTVV